MAGILVPRAHVHFEKSCARGPLKARDQQETADFKGLCCCCGGGVGGDGGGGVGGGRGVRMAGKGCGTNRLFSSSRGWSD